MDRSLRLAALASAAVPGLDPMAVQEVVSGDDEHFDVAFIQDTQQRRWVIRAPRDEVSAARMDASLAMLALLHRRVPFAVPAAKGFAPIAKIGRAAVHTYIPGHPLDLAALRPGHPVTAELGRTIALIHNVDRALFDEAGLASYDAETYRRRHLAEIDRGAATGRVPAGLLSRWEEALDDVRLWRFAPTPVHGALAGSDVLVTFPDPTDASRATIRGVTGWEDAKVADPADDFAALVTATSPEVVEAVLAAYAHVRVERPDEHLLARARLVSELSLLAALLRAVKSRDEVTTEATTARLRRLDDAVHGETQAARRLRIVPPGAVDPDQSSSARTGSGSTSPGSDSPGSDPPGADSSGADLSGSASSGADSPGADSDASGSDANSTPTDARRTAAAVDDDATDVIDTVDVDAPPAERDPSSSEGVVGSPVSRTDVFETNASDDESDDDESDDDESDDDESDDTSRSGERPPQGSGSVAADKGPGEPGHTSG